MRTLLFLLFCCLPICAFGQNPIGLPEIINYEKTTYGAGTQNWAIQQDRNGILYFANNEGLLTFDGTYWKVYPLPNKTIVRSVAIAADHRIYVGGQDEFGFFSPDQHGLLQFHSLKHRIPAAYRSFADIWDIVSTEKEVFFRAEKRIFALRLADNTIRVFPAAADWIFLGKANNRIIAQDKKRGLLHYRQGKWAPLLKAPVPPNLRVTSVSPFSGDTILVTTWEHGLFTFARDTLRPLHHFGADRYADKQIEEAFKLNADLLVVATNTNGCYLVNKSGSVQYNFSRKSGLLNNAVLSMLRDNNNNIWLGLNNGINFIAYNDAIKHINPEAFADGVGHTSVVHQHNLYLGLSGAVFKLPLPQGADISLLPDRFTYVANTGGQAWGMNVVNGRLLLGKHEGAFEIKDAVAQPIATGKGYWNFLPYKQKNQAAPLLLAVNYNGIDFFRYANGAYRLAGAVKDFPESARFITVGHNHLVWASHPYKGVYKINLLQPTKPAITLYTHRKGLPSAYNNHVYRVKNKIVVSTEKGIYEYNPAQDRFVLSPFFRDIFGSLYIRYLKEDAQGNVWFIQEKNLGVVDFSQKKPRLIYIPELNGKLVGGFEHINPVNRHNILVGAQQGFFHINYERYLQSPNNLKVRISLVQVLGRSDSLLFGGYFGEANQKGRQSAVPAIPYGRNSYHFAYAAPYNKNQANIAYSYYLEGFDQRWSLYDKKTEKDYTNLPPGDYTFFVRARNHFGSESAAAPYRFTILPPWYQTITAYVAYVAATLLFIYFIYKRQQRKFLKQRLKFQQKQDRIRYLHQLEIDKSEKEIVKLKNEKLETEIEAKNSELASTAMHLVQKAELLARIKNELTKLNKGADDDEPQPELKKIIRLLTAEEKADEGWEQFSRYFDKVHTNFLEELKSAFPHITANDLRLSAYLKMNLSTKEIAQLMKISPRGVEISRYRLRKKLQVPGEVSLFEFFRDFQLYKVPAKG